MRAHRCSTLVCDVHALAPDAAAIDALARLQLAARRVGLEVRLCHASKELCGLLELVGLSDVLRVEDSCHMKPLMIGQEGFLFFKRIMRTDYKPDLAQVCKLSQVACNCNMTYMDGIK